MSTFKYESILHSQSKLIRSLLLPTQDQWSPKTALGTKGVIGFCSVTVLCSSSPFPFVAKSTFWYPHHWNRGEGTATKWRGKVGRKFFIWCCKSWLHAFWAWQMLNTYSLVDASVGSLEAPSGMSHSHSINEGELISLPIDIWGPFLTLCESAFTSTLFPLKSLHLLCGHVRLD